jgi:hypothetical protein
MWRPHSIADGGEAGNTSQLGRFWEPGGSFLALNQPNAVRKSLELPLVRGSIRSDIGSAPVDIITISL